ncbi:MAG: TnsA endonuclease N-terminal domain-containing protein [Pyrinomonadaceae bacterium]
MGQQIWSESILERDCAVTYECDRNVLRYFGQGARIYYELDGRRRTYTADFVVHRETGRPQIVEVKLRRNITPWFEQLFRIITPMCDEAGYDFVVLTEIEIRIEPFLSNIKRQLYYSRTPIHPQHYLLCDEFFRTNGQSTLGHMVDFFAARNCGRSIVFALMHRGVISTVHSVPLTMNSPVQPGSTFE